jgi:signal transduction histidine kinase
VQIIFDNYASIPYSGDLEEMEIILNNLLSNAIKYNTRGGKVVCTLTQSEKEVIICISDTGVGIAQEDLPQIFQEFARIRTPKTKDISGSGLGLSIVKRLVELYGGRIEVESTVNQGTSFFVHLPNSLEKV